MIERNCLANHCGIGAKTTLPKAVADDGHRMGTWSAIFLRQERAPLDRLDSQDVEVVAGDHFTNYLFNIFRAAKFELLDMISSQSGENFLLFTKNQKVLVSTGFVRTACVADVKFDQSFRLSYGAGPEKDGINDAENGCIRADPDRQRNERNRPYA